MSHLSSTQHDAYHEICCETFIRGDAYFMHQHVVDAFAAQDATADGRPIRLAFALIGLCLFVEHQCSGKQVQQAHMKLAKTKRPWPTFALPEDRGEIMASDLVAAPVGTERDQKIADWCQSVWQSFADSHNQVRRLLRDSGYFQRWFPQ